MKPKGLKVPFRSYLDTAVRHLGDVSTMALRAQRRVNAIDSSSDVDEECIKIKVSLERIGAFLQAAYDEVQRELDYKEPEDDDEPEEDGEPEEPVEDEPPRKPYTKPELTHLSVEEGRSRWGATFSSFGLYVADGQPVPDVIDRSFRPVAGVVVYVSPDRHIHVRHPDGFDDDRGDLIRSWRPEREASPGDFLRGPSFEGVVLIDTVAASKTADGSARIVFLRPQDHHIRVHHADGTVEDRGAV